MRCVLVCGLLMCALLVGCADHTLCAKGVEAYTDNILPEFSEYVKQDGGLTEKEKSYRQDAVEGLRKFLDELKKRKD